MKKLIVNYLKVIHRCLPYGIRRIYCPLLKSVRIINSFILPVFYYEGEEHTSGTALNLAYLGRDVRIQNYWIERFLRPNYKVRKIKLVPLWRVNAFFKVYATQNDVDLAIIEINKITKKIIKNKSGFVLPRWLETQLIVDKAFNIMEKGDIVKRIRKNALTAEFSNSVEDLHFFYERMLKPYISLRHKDAAVIPDYKYYLHILKKKDSSICFIRMDGELVAGSISAYFNNTPKLLALGVIDGREEYKKLGVIGALYYFQVAEFQRRNINKLFLGGSSPILTDGVTKFKVSIGSEATAVNYLEDEYLWILPFTYSKGVREMLLTNPFISIDKNKLYENIFVDTDFDSCNEKHLNNFIEYTKSDNIQSTKVFCFNNKDLVSEWLEKQLLNKVEIIDFNKEMM